MAWLAPCSSGGDSYSSQQSTCHCPPRAQGTRMGWLAVSLGFGLSFGVVIFMFGRSPCRHPSILHCVSRHGGAIPAMLACMFSCTACCAVQHAAFRLHVLQATSLPTSTRPRAWRCG